MRHSGLARDLNQRHDQRQLYFSVVWLADKRALLAVPATMTMSVVNAGFWWSFEKSTHASWTNRDRNHLCSHRQRVAFCYRQALERHCHNCFLVNLEILRIVIWATSFTRYRKDLSYYPTDYTTRQNYM